MSYCPKCGDPSFLTTYGGGPCLECTLLVPKKPKGFIERIKRWLSPSWIDSRR